MLTMITVVRNDVKGIEETLKSVISQKSPSIEYVVIDGASEDGTLEIIEKYRAGIDILVSEKDSGIYDALNKGIRLAHGDIIGTVHSSDTVLPGVLKIVTDLHDRKPEAILYGCVKAMKDGEFDSVWGWTHRRLPQGMIPHPATFVPRKVYGTYGAYDESFGIAGDYDAFLRFYMNGVEFSFTDLIMQEFDMTGISQRSSSEAEVKRIKAAYGLEAKITADERFRRKVKDLVHRAIRGAGIVIGKNAKR